jgi:peptidoglycan-N-acetylglucosamine deacetylase
LTMHPHINGYRSLLWILEELIRCARSRGEVWFATHTDVAAWAQAAGAQA